MAEPRVAPHVAVVGLGYVGLTLAVALARAGTPVIGVETDPRIRASLRARQPVLHEPGVAQALASLPPESLRVVDELPATGVGAVVICVGTPVDPETKQVDLRSLRAATAAVAARVEPGTLVVVRSTVPVGTSRRLVLPLLRSRLEADPLLAFCPERTIQGQALTELTALPQIVGGLDERSAAAAERLFAPVVQDHVRVSSLESAELVKLVCNAHTDVLYGFGNEVAFLAEAFGVDAAEVVASANLRYPRPDLARPGFVGGSCLTKDPHLLVHAGAEAGHRPLLIAAAREVNERVPHAVVEHVLKAVEGQGRPAAETKVLVCGMAYKGRPETDDVRGSAAEILGRELRGRVGVLAGHDYLVPEHRIAQLGFRPESLAAGLAGADLTVVLVDHPRYREDLGADVVRRAMRPPAAVFDVWGDLAGELSGTEHVSYRRFGHG